MTDTFSPSVLLLPAVLFDIVSGCDQMPQPWVLKRADSGSSQLSFTNNTVTGAHVLVRWTWRDSADGVWDTRLKVTLDKEEIVGGGFVYSDRDDNELTWVRWFKMKRDGAIRWKYGSSSTPPDSWWLTSTVPWGNMTWGFKNQITDGSWVFRVGNETLEPKNFQNVDGWPQAMAMGNRWRRSQSSRYQVHVKSWPVQYDHAVEKPRDVFANTDQAAMAGGDDVEHGDVWQWTDGRSTDGNGSGAARTRGCDDRRTDNTEANPCVETRGGF